MKRFGNKEKSAPKTNGGGGLYFKKPLVKVIHSGCTTLDCALAGPKGGWASGRIINLVGDQSVGKSLLAIEACANFAFQSPRGHIWYREAEAAFDVPYAESVGLPQKRVDFGPQGTDTLWSTVEDIYEDLERCIAKAEKTKQPGLYIVDSLDALSAREELKRKIDKSSYKTDKAKVLSELFRRDVTRRAKRANVTILIISQLRDKIGVTFGEKKTRSGGKALNFYASQIVWLSHVSTIVNTVHNIKRVVGVRIRARVKKNKIGTPFGDIEFVIRFSWGVDDAQACLDWLLAQHEITEKEHGKRLEHFMELRDTDIKQFDLELAALQKLVRRTWSKVDGYFTPPSKKYHGQPLEVEDYL